MILAVISMLTFLTVLVTVLPLSKIQHWMIRDWDFPRLQILGLSFLILLSILFFLKFDNTSAWLLTIIILLVMAWQIWWIIPYTPIWNKEVKKSTHYDKKTSLSIITSNVLTTNKNSQALIDLVNEYKPDILLTLESDKWWEKELEVIEKEMPYTVKYPLDNLYGIHLYSKLKLHDPEISFLVEKDVPSIHVALELRNGEKVRAHFLHPAPPSPTENTESSERDAELIIVAKSISKTDQPTIVTGDLNDVAWSSTTRLFRKISGLLDPRIGRGIFNTFHANYPLLRWPLDHLFHSKHFTLHSIKRLSHIGSDHFPLYTSLVLHHTEGKNQEGLTAEMEDFERAKEITEKKNVDDYSVPTPDN